MRVSGTAFRKTSDISDALTIEAKTTALLVMDCRTLMVENFAADKAAFAYAETVVAGFRS
jgi:hypothetical protein